MGITNKILCNAAVYYGKDHRTDEQVGNVQEVLDGNLKDLFFLFKKAKMNVLEKIIKDKRRD